MICSSDKTKDADQRRASTKARHVRLAHLGILPLAPQRLNPPSSQHRSFLRNTPLNQHTTKHHQLLTAHPNQHTFLTKPFPGKENSNCVLCPPRSKTSSPSVCRPNFPTTSGPDRQPPRLDSFARMSSPLTPSLCDGLSTGFPSKLSGVRATCRRDRRRHALPTLANSCVPNRPLRRSR